MATLLELFIFVVPGDNYYLKDGFSNGVTSHKVIAACVAFFMLFFQIEPSSVCSNIIKP